MREFLAAMGKEGLVEEIGDPVPYEYTPAQMAARTDKILLFRDIGGKQAVMNLTASRRTLALAL
ncbi:MAG: UbiD family decarboxylase, partial [Methanomicrobia archaeon]|nr:UbiD family decarboxylase [Methanomicrobia archaeon]